MRYEGLNGSNPASGNIEKVSDFEIIPWADLLILLKKNNGFLERSIRLTLTLHSEYRCPQLTDGSIPIPGREITICGGGSMLDLEGAVPLQSSLYFGRSQGGVLEIGAPVVSPSRTFLTWQNRVPLEYFNRSGNMPDEKLPKIELFSPVST